VALITPNFRELGFFPENPLSKCEPYANQGKESTAAASEKAWLASFVCSLGRSDFCYFGHVRKEQNTKPTKIDFSIIPALLDNEV